MKKIISLVIVFVMLFSLAGVTVAQAAEVTVFVDGKQLAFDQPPVIENGRTLVPVRLIAEKLGADVTWDDATRTATITKGNDVITMAIDNNIITKNGFEIEIDQPPVIRGSRTLIPARALAESLECKVDWDGDAYRVDVTTVVDEAFDTVKNFLLENGTKIDLGYAVAFSAGEVFQDEEFAGESIYLGYSIVTNELIFGYIYQEEGDSALVFCGRGEDTFLVAICEQGTLYDVTESTPKAEMVFNSGKSLKMITNNIATAYEIEQSIVEEFAGEAADTALLDTAALLKALDIGVTIGDLGFTNYNVEVK